MALMRHRDPSQTAKTYTDARMLPLKEAIQKLNFHRAETPGADDTQPDTQTLVAGGHLLSTIVTLPVMAESEKSRLFTGVKSPFVPLCHNGSKEAKWSERQDLNLRRLGPKPSETVFSMFSLLLIFAYLCANLPAKIQAFHS